MRVRSLSTIFAAMLLGACEDTSATEGKVHAKAGDAKGGVDPATAKDLAQAREVVRGVAKDQRNYAAGKGLALAEAQRLPTKVAEAFEKVAGLPADDRRLLAASSAITRPVVVVSLELLCEGKGVDTLQQVTKTAPVEQVGVLWDRCKLDRTGLFTRAEADTAHVGSLLLAQVAHQIMRDNGGASEDERELLRVFAIDSAAR